MFTRFLDLFFKWFYSPDICSFQLFALNPDCSFIFEWQFSRYMKWCPDSCFCGAYLCFHTVLTTEGVIIPTDLHWTVMVKIISSCLCSPVVVQSAMRLSFYFVAVTDKALSTVLVGRVNGAYYCLFGWTLMSLIFTDSSQWYQMCITCNNDEYAPV